MAVPVIDEVARERIGATNTRLAHVEEQQESTNSELSQIRVTLASIAPWVKLGSLAASGIVTTLVVLVIERIV